MKIKRSALLRKPLLDTVPQYEPPEDDPNAPNEEWVEVQRGVIRIVRNRKRARKLKRRGVVMWTSLGPHGQIAWLWFVDHPRLNAERDKRVRDFDREHGYDWD